MSVKDKVIIRQYPKAVFFYPTFLVAIFASVYLQAGFTSDRLLGAVFCASFAFNFLVVAIEFSKSLFINMLIGLTTLLFCGLWLRGIYPGLFAKLLGLAANVEIVMSEDFYLAMTAVFGAAFVMIILEARFEYCEITSNELIVHSGLFSDVKRYPAPSLRYEQSISDVFESFLLRSGRLKLFITGEKEPIVLDNVPFIKSKFAALDNILSRTEVKVVDNKG
jgi:hypothetical protein